MSKREWIKKIAVIIIGSVIAAYGITLASLIGQLQREIHVRCFA